MHSVLYVFAISHYCEKARWLLDRSGMEYQLVHLAPGLHAKAAKKLGAGASTLPILECDGELVQGSSAIGDWLEPRLPEAEQSGGDREACRAIETRLDDLAGVHVRRYYYSEALVDDPGSVRGIFTRDLPLMQKVVVGAAWSRVAQTMIQRMDLGPTQHKESRAIVNEELGWLDALLEDGRTHLVGQRFTRADIAAASIFAPLAGAPEHPTYAALAVPPGVGKDVEAWRDRPSLRWVRDIYRQFR